MRSKIEQQVMAGVAAVYVARKLVSRTALECYALFATSFCLTLFVSVSNVFRNFLSVERGGLPSVFTYLTYAVLHTSALVQITLALGLIAFMLLARDAVRASIAPKFA